MYVDSSGFLVYCLLKCYEEYFQSLSIILITRAGLPTATALAGMS